MISLQKLTKVYFSKEQPIYALRDIDLHVNAGEIFGVLGKSGSGKSTLLRSINLLERPTQGKVIVDGVDLESLDSAALRQQRHQMSFVFQHFNLLASRTAFENIALPLELQGLKREVIEPKVNALLALVDMNERRDHMPDELSGGQKQRVAIARALATEPQILLCDEATSALDPEATQSILQLLKKINRELGVTILLITHELDVVKRICDRVGILHEGQFVEIGTTLSIFSKPQSEITKRLVSQSLHIHIPEIPFDLKSQQVTGEQVLIVQLTFVGEDSDAPLISQLVKQFDITVNIQQANIEKINDTTMGFTVCRLSGPSNEVKKALDYISRTSIKVEILNQ